MRTLRAVCCSRRPMVAAGHQYVGGGGRVVEIRWPATTRSSRTSPVIRASLRIIVRSNRGACALHVGLHRNQLARIESNSTDDCYMTRLAYYDSYPQGHRDSIVVLNIDSNYLFRVFHRWWDIVTEIRRIDGKIVKRLFRPLFRIFAWRYFNGT